jgi:hypothetical protein
VSANSFFGAFEKRIIDWHVLRAGKFEELSIDNRGVIRSEAFPGLWLDAPAMVRGDMAQILAVLQQGIASPEHAAFFEHLKSKAEKALFRPLLVHRTFRNFHQDSKI